jgi:hypothetical protein
MRPEFRLLLLGLAFAATGIAHAEPPLNDSYAYAFPLEVPDDHAAVRIDLTPAVYAASLRDAGLADMVVVNSEGRAVPFDRLPEAPPIVHPYVMKTKLLPIPAASPDKPDAVHIQRTAAGDIVIDQHQQAGASQPVTWLIDARRSIALQTLTFPTFADEDVQIHVAIDASDDLKTWEERTYDDTIVSVKNGEDMIEQRTVTVRTEGTPARYYRLRLLDGKVSWPAAKAPEVTLDGNYTDATADRDAGLQWITLDGAATAGASGGTDYDYKLPAALPIEAARVELADTNTAARFDLMTTNDVAATPSWETLATITAVHLGTAKGKDKATEFSPVRRQELRLHTATPLPKAPKLVVAWRPDAFVFLGEGSAPFRLLVGSYASRRADYPMDDAINTTRTDRGADWSPAVAVVGARVDAAGPAALVAPKVPYDWTKPLLWLVLVAGAALVIGMAFSLLRQSKVDNKQP